MRCTAAGFISGGIVQDIGFFIVGDFDAGSDDRRAEVHDLVLRCIVDRLPGVRQDVVIAVLDCNV